MGGIDLQLYRHYGHADLYLVDKTYTEPRIWYGFAKEGAFYNNLDVAAKFLYLNGVSSQDVYLVDTDDFHTLSVQADLVISLFSWGYHYPVSTYVKRVYELLKPNGVLILDIRRNSDGVKQLKEIFRSIEIVSESDLHSLTRVKAVKP